MTEEEGRFVEEMALACEGMGMPTTAGRILGLLLICEPPRRTAGELVETLGASAGAVSQNLRLLRSWGLVEPTAVPGSRSSHFRIVERAWTRLTRDRLERIVGFRRLAERGLEIAGPGREPAALEEMRNYYRFMERELPRLLERFEAEHAGAEEASSGARQGD